MTEHEPLQILLVEDNPGDAFLVKFYLEESVWKQARIIHAEYLKTALDLLSKNAFDVILIDLNLPDSIGIETLNEILKTKGEAVVIVLTGLQDEELGTKAVQLGAHDFLIKGQFDGKVFNSSIKYAFERVRTKHELNEKNKNISRLEFRFNVVQRLNRCGYWRVIRSDMSVFCSDYFLELLQLSKHVETFDEWLQLFVPADKPRIEQMINHIDHDQEIVLDVALANGRAATITAIRATPSGTTLDVVAGILKLK